MEEELHMCVCKKKKQKFVIPLAKKIANITAWVDKIL